MPLRRTNLQFAHILRTEERTFIFVPPEIIQQPKIIAKGLAAVYADFCFVADQMALCKKDNQIFDLSYNVYGRIDVA